MFAGYASAHNDMRVEIFCFLPIDSRMYLMAEGNQAVVVDPCVDPHALELLETAGTEQITVLLTHEHYDHISGVNWLKEHYPCKVICSAACAAGLTDDKKDMSRYFDALLMGRFRKEHLRKTLPYTCEATDVFEDRFVLDWQGHTFRMRKTPGHSPGSICILMDEKYLFTGDTLLKEDKIITRLPGGSRQQYEEITKPWLDSLSEELYVYPGHGEGGLLKDFPTWRPDPVGERDVRRCAGTDIR